MNRNLAKTAAVVVLAAAAFAAALSGLSPGKDRPSRAEAAGVPTTTSTSTTELSTTTTAAPQLEIGPGRILWFGDSLTDSSTASLNAAFSRHFDGRSSLELSKFGGTALCDWLDAIDAGLHSEPKPSAVVLTFYGNNFTPCMGATGTGPGTAQGSPEFYARYEDGMDRVDAWADAAGVPVVWVQTPPRSPGVEGGPVEVRNALTGLAERHGWPVLPAGEALAGPDGGFSMWLPCSSDAEPGCVDGQVKVRDDDLVHFAKAADGSTPGSERWAEAAMTLLRRALVP